jgi:hypothetical protein
VAGDSILSAQIWALRAPSGSGRARPGHGCAISSGRRSGSGWGWSDGNASTAAWRWELNEPVGSARPDGHGLLLCCVRSVTAISGGGRALLRVGHSVAPPSRLSLLDPSVSFFWLWLDSGGDCKIVVARAGGRRVRWSAMEHWGRGFLGVGRNHCRMPAPMR